jgi:membrane fusion protein, heavy metal efflux system
MRIPFLRHRRGRRRWLSAALTLLALGAAAAIGRWSPQAQEWLAGAATTPQHEEHASETAHDEHDEHEHDAKPLDGHAHDEAAAIQLSPAAQKNIGLRLAKVALGTFERTMTVPGIVIERPGWSVAEVTAPMTGVVTRIYPIQGEAVGPGQPLFDVRLTHEDLLQVQTEFLRTVEQLDVIAREVERLERASADGVIAGKTLLERKYEQQKEQAALRAQRQALLLHGLSESQVDAIVSTRTLLQSLTIRAPATETGKTDGSNSPLPLGGGSGVRAKIAAGLPIGPHPNPLPKGEGKSWQVQELKVAQGKHVAAGDTLCTLADLAALYIEGVAFEQDIAAINAAAAEGRQVAAVLGVKPGGGHETLGGLRILYLDDKVERESRAFHFFVALSNHVLREDRSPDGRRFVYWQFKPGQRMQIRVPVEQWAERIVLPLDAVAQDGPEFYVFELNGGHFDRRAVHVEYRDEQSVVIANDGAVRLGATVAVTNAHQLQVALKNKSGGGVDPHAGHNH